MAAQNKLALMRDRATRWKGVQRIDEHELRLWLVTLPEDFDGTSTTEPLPALNAVEPTPRILFKPIDTVVEREGEGLLAARLNKYEISEISRRYTDQDLRAAYFLVVPRGTVLTPEDVQKTNPHIYVRYRLLGIPQMFEKGWSLSLIEVSSN
ncbi:MAG TPA: hypothetical protein VF747_11805 [Blastocatellia bacterium]|jgi:hypothetical protein